MATLPTLTKRSTRLQLRHHLAWPEFRSDGFSNWDSTPTQEKITATDIGVSYSSGGMTLVATSASGKQGNRTDKYSNIGVSYTIAPGITAMVESGRGEVDAADFDATWAGLSVDF